MCPVMSLTKSLYDLWLLEKKVRLVFRERGDMLFTTPLVNNHNFNIHDRRRVLKKTTYFPYWRGLVASH